MSTFVKTTDNSQSLGQSGIPLSVNSDVTFKGKVVTAGTISAGGNFSAEGNINTVGTTTCGGLVTATNGLTVSNGAVTLPPASVAIAALVGNFVDIGGNQTVIGNKTFNGAVTNTGGISGTGNLATNGTISCLGSMWLYNALVTPSLMYETVNATGGVVNAYTINYATGGLFEIQTSPNAASTLVVTNIPVDTTKSYTFTLVSTQASTRFFINTVQIQDTNSGYITNNGAAGFVAPLWNGGLPVLSGTTSCVIIQQFTVISVGGYRKVICSVSCCS